MQHCQQKNYVSDNHCCDCGEQLNEKPQLHSVEQLQPELLSTLKGYCPSAHVITGKITSMHYYKRNYKDRENNLTYAYWWISIEDNTGQSHQFSIDAENKYLKLLLKGDVISLVIHMPYGLHYSIAYAADKNIVRNDSLAPIVIAHKEKGQYSSMHDSLLPGKRDSTGLWALVAVICFCAALFGLDLKALEAAGIALFFTVITFIWELLYARKKHRIAHEIYDELKNVRDGVLDISDTQLGYQLHSRGSAESDVICFGCKKRISKDINHCYLCGHSQNKTQPATISTQQTADSTSAELHINTVADLELQLMSEYCDEYRNKYTHRNVLAKNTKGEIFHQCMLAKVIDKVQNVDVNHSTSTYTTQVRTDTYRGGVFQKSDYETHVRRFENRRSSLKGMLILETKDFSTLKLPVNEHILGSIDIGDWYFHATSCVEINGWQTTYLESAHNLSKNIVYSGRSVTRYGYTSGFGLMFLLFIAALVSTIFIDGRDYLPFLDQLSLRPLTRQLNIDLDFLPLIAFALTMAVVTVWSSVYALINTVSQKRSVAKLRNKIASVKKNLNSIRQKIEQLR